MLYCVELCQYICLILCSYIISCADPELEITPRNVLNRLKCFSYDKWHQLGMQLKVPEHKLAEFHANHPRSVYHCLMNTIKFWINNCNDVTWEEICEALCHDTVEDTKLGNKIMDWYRTKKWKDPRKVSIHSR